MPLLKVQERGSAPLPCRTSEGRNGPRYSRSISLILPYMKPVLGNRLEKTRQWKVQALGRSCSGNSGQHRACRALSLACAASLMAQLRLHPCIVRVHRSGGPYSGGSHSRLRAPICQALCQLRLAGLSHAGGGATSCSSEGPSEAGTHFVPTHLRLCGDQPGGNFGLIRSRDPKHTCKRREQWVRGTERRQSLHNEARASWSGPDATRTVARCTTASTTRRAFPVDSTTDVAPAMPFGRGSWVLLQSGPGPCVALEHACCCRISAREPCSCTPCCGRGASSNNAARALCTLCSPVLSRFILVAVGLCS